MYTVYKCENCSQAREGGSLRSPRNRRINLYSSVDVATRRAGAKGEREKRTLELSHRDIHIVHIR